MSQQKPLGPTFDNTQFQGAGYNPVFDKSRLTGQIEKIYNLMCDGVWRTLREISTATGAGESSASAQLRNLRKAPHNLTVEKRRRGAPRNGLWEYRIV